MKSKQITFLSLIFVAYPVRAHNFIISIPHSPRKESGKFNFSSLYICGFFVYNILANLIWNAKGIFVMSMLEFEEYKGKLNTLKPALDDLQDALHLEEAKRQIAELQEESAQDGFWNNVSHSQQVQQRIKQLQTKCEKYDKLCSSWDDLFTMCEMALEEDDASMLEELKAEYDTLSEKLEEMRLSTLLTGEYDANNAILTFHAGAGGTEAQD